MVQFRFKSQAIGGGFRQNTSHQQLTGLGVQLRKRPVSHAWK